MAAVWVWQPVKHGLGLCVYRWRVVARVIAVFPRVIRHRIMTVSGIGDVEANVLLSEERLLGPL